MKLPTQTVEIGITRELRQAAGQLIHVSAFYGMRGKSKYDPVAPPV